MLCLLSERQKVAAVAELLGSLGHGLRGARDDVAVKVVVVDLGPEGSAVNLASSCRGDLGVVLAKELLRKDAGRNLALDCDRGHERCKAGVKLVLSLVGEHSVGAGLGKSAHDLPVDTSIHGRSDGVASKLRAALKVHVNAVLFTVGRSCQDNISAAGKLVTVGSLEDHEGVGTNELVHGHGEVLC